MSNLNIEKDYSNLTDALQFVFDQLLKTLFISIPGIIETYDQSKKRCRVKPAINIRLTDGTTAQQSSIINVPVIWPSGGGFTLISPLPAGTPVEIKFSQRGITRFKQTFSQEDPGNGVFEKEDAHVIPSYGALSISPATQSGMSMQSEDGSNYIYVENGTIKIKSTSKIILDTDTDITGNLNITGIITGDNVFSGSDSNTHIHTQGPDSDGDTQQNTGVAQ